MDLFQEAGNATHTAKTAETREQIMYKMLAAAHRILLEWQRGPRQVDVDEVWKRALREAGRGKPEFRDEIPHMLTFVRNLAGGIEEPVHLNYYRSFLRTLEGKLKIITGQDYENIAAVAIGQQHACPKLRIALCMAAASASAEYSTNGVQTLIDVNRLKSKEGVPHALHAEEMIEQAEEIAKRSGAEGAKCQMAEYLFRIRLVHHILRKPDKTRGVFNTVGEIGLEYLQQLSAILGKPITGSSERNKSQNNENRNVAINHSTKNESTSGETQNIGPSSWKAPEAPKQERKAAQCALSVEYDASGRIKNQVQLLADRGFTVGAALLRIGDDSKSVYTIRSMTDAKCVVEDAGGAQTKILHSGLDLFRVTTAPAKTTSWMPDQIKQYDPLCNSAWQAEVKFSKLKVAMNDYHAAHGTSDGFKYEVSTKGKLCVVGVVATQKFERGSLRFVPLTSIIVLRAEGETASGVDTGMLFQQAGCKKRVLEATNNNQFEFDLGNLALRTTR